MRDPSGWVVAFELNLPLVRVNWPIPTVYDTISSPINASPVLTDIPPNKANGVVLATDTTVPSDVNSDDVDTRVVSGLTFLISTLFVAPWCAWLYCVTSNTLPVNKSLVGNDEVFWG